MPPNQPAMGGAPGMGASGGMTSNNQNLMKMLEYHLKSPSSPQQIQGLMELLKRNPALMDAYIKRKSQNPQGAHGAQGPPSHRQPPGHMPSHMPPHPSAQQQMRSDVWHHRAANPMQSGMYQQQSAGYQQQLGPRGGMMPPGMSQYGVVGTQSRYHTPPDNASLPQVMGQVPRQPLPNMRGSAPPVGGGVSGQGGMSGMLHNQLMQQVVRSPNTSHPQHTRSPQPSQPPSQSPRQQVSAPSPAMLSSDGSVIGSMMQQGPGTPGANHSYPNINPPNNTQQPDYDTQGYGTVPPNPPQQNNGSEALDNFLNSL